MPEFRRPFSGFSVDDTAKARSFYVDVVGLTVNESDGMLRIDLGDDHFVIVYPKGDAHEPASFTVLNLPVDDVTAAVRELASRGVEFARYDGMPQDEDGVMKGQGPDIAWFTHPAGNVISVISA
ncbi:catechol 2,3-dioxygenase-like lactoylglutathione lyase family enzyme [Aeromicrobium panaciterrae]|uniref:Catechol 2,3-dioxygenase-like lactoylglutathione lyase family enzyme n=1 Tax=Aeromicrobium panaciterrae TaxID=363861 RepID=A0ABU1UP05_9ACTN|nr:VOC family protein [Aeromicrobium panaciterrae]MDR7086902.1 catechol 2,3-dioxygenase-like lactoylglutathione lyase family enzyme [Aeromicrobium panaciterrae]